MIWEGYFNSNAAPSGNIVMRGGQLLVVLFLGSFHCKDDCLAPETSRINAVCMKLVAEVSLWLLGCCICLPERERANSLLIKLTIASVVIVQNPWEEKLFKAGFDFCLAFTWTMQMSTAALLLCIFFPRTFCSSGSPEVAKTFGSCTVCWEIVCFKIFCFYWNHQTKQ